VLPFKEEIKEDFYIRTFSSDVDETELVWHRDKEDRIVEVVENNGWMFQYDNEIPKTLKENIFIPKNTYHRIIKGNGDLVLKIKKLK
jgi:hypothetical protein